MPHLKLKDAFLCLDCETIGTDPRECVVCLSHAVHSVASFLNRSKMPEDVRAFLISPYTSSMCEMIDRVLERYPMPDVEDARG